MNKFLDKYKQSKLTQVKMYNLNIFHNSKRNLFIEYSIKDIEFLMKTIPSKFPHINTL